MPRVVAPPYAIAGLNVALCVVAALVGELGGSAPVATAMTVAFSATGGLVARRVPGNPIGWLLLASGTGAALAVLSPVIADRGIAGAGPPSEAARIAAAYASASWIPMMLPSLTFVLLLFPDGRLLPGRRWRAAAWCAGAGLAATLVGVLFKPGPLEDYPRLVNPLGVESLGIIEGPGFVLLIAGLLASAASLVARYRRSAVAQREQIKWLAFAGAVAAGTFAAAFPLFGLLPPVALYAAMMLSVLGIPVAAALAILRHRLYDIDVVIRRTLVYAVLTATVAGTYLLSVLVLQLVLPARSDVAIAASTLAAAALVRPARARIQHTVDRRFYRRRYDAEQTLAAFTARMRDELELSALSDELRDTVARTVQPAHVALWLRDR